MNNNEPLNHLFFQITSLAHCRLGTEWNYKNIISSFSRLYLITKGEAFIQMNEKQLTLKNGFMYLIPPFAQSSYRCPDFMEQYYATFTVSLPGKQNIYQLYNFKNEVKAESFHYDIFEKLCTLNSGMGLPTGNPKVYQKQIKLGIEETTSYSAANSLKSAGILNMLFAEFIETPKIKPENETHNRIIQSIQFIHNHLDESLSVTRLAKETSLSADHYTRLFKELTAQTPLDYINQQRVEQAINLINSSQQTIGEIAYRCGFSSSTYFGKVFKRYTGQTPGEYQKNQIYSIE